MEKATAISLFTGIGGFDIGMSRVGFSFEKLLEWNQHCCETLNRNKLIIGSTEEVIQPVDITLKSPDTFYDKPIDYIVGGPPCQSFSAAGRRAGGVQGTDDSRGVLFGYYCKYVKHFAPKAFVFENVRGILASKGGEDFKTICEAFRDVGYTLYWRVLNAADYGVPQNRERLFLVGIRADLDVRFRFPKPTHGLDSPNKRPYITAGDALKELENEREVVPAYGGKYGHLLPDIPPGENYRYYTEELGHEKPLFAWRSKFSGFLYKLSPNEVSRTIVASQSRYDGPFHWKNRKCTIDELKRLQGFPDEFVIPHPYNEAVKQIGNSVCPPIATQIGKALRFQVEGINTKTAGTDLYVTEIGEKDWPRVRRAINRLESDYMKITSGNIFKLITDKPLKDSTALTSEQLKGYLESAIPNTAKKCPISTSRNWRREKNTKKDSDYIAVTQSWLPVKDQTEVAQELGATIVRHARWLSPKDADEEEWAKRFKYELEKREKSMAWFLKNNDYTDEIRIYLNEQYSEDVINDEDGDGDFMDRQLLQVA